MAIGLIGIEKSTNASTKEVSKYIIVATLECIIPQSNATLLSWMECFYVSDITLRIQCVLFCLCSAKKCHSYWNRLAELVLNFKIENSDPVLDIKCIFCTEMILHALTWILELKEKTNISMCKNEFDLFLVVFQYLIIICLFLLVSRITYYYHR